MLAGTPFSKQEVSSGRLCKEIPTSLASCLHIRLMDAGCAKSRFSTLPVRRECSVLGQGHVVKVH